MPKRGLGPGDYEKWLEFQKRFKVMQDEMNGMAPLFERSPHTWDADSDSSDVEGSTSSQANVPSPGKNEGKNSTEESNKSEAQTHPTGETVTADPEVMDILGIDNAEGQEKEPIVDPSLVKAWYKLINKGFEKDKKDELLNRYPMLSEFEPKKLNPEIAASLSTKHVKKDSHMCELQKIVGAGLMAAGTILTNILREEDCDKLMIVKLLNDLAKFLIELHHSISVSRKVNIYIPNLTPQIAELIKKSAIDETLFGKNLSELIKESKALVKLSQDIKQKPIPPAVPKGSFFRNSLQQRKPLSQQSGNNQARNKSKPLFRTKQQFFNRSTRNLKENTFQTRK